MVVREYPNGVVHVDKLNYLHRDNGGESTAEPCLGMEFNSADESRQFYALYATRKGFKIRTGQLYRSRTDGSVSSRRFVCSKEGFQLSSRNGCPAFIRVQARDSGKWVIDQIQKEHNHELGPDGENRPVIMHQRSPTARKRAVDVTRRPRTKLQDEIDYVQDGIPCPSGIINVKRLKREGDVQEVHFEPYVGLQFNSANDAYQFYQAFAESSGFRIRIGQLFRSKHDGSITSRRFVCSKEGFQHPSRLGCGAFMRIKKQEDGSWVVDRFQKDHNHVLGFQLGSQSQNQSPTALKRFHEDFNGGLDSVDLSDINGGHIIQGSSINNIENEWYTVLLEYFQIKQAEDSGFFYSVEVENGNCRSIFWADGRSRFSCSQFGDAIVFDTSYRKGNHELPFATFVGVNHHRKPVLLGCALIADESRESFTWLFETWLRAMSGRRPKSIIADQDTAIQQAIAQILPGTHHRFSTWQMRAKERENFRLVGPEFKLEYDKCIYRSQTTAEFQTSWCALISKYGLKENVWLKEMYDKRSNWVPVYLLGTFFAGIPMNGSTESFFGDYVNDQTPFKDFISQYEEGLEQRRVEERKEDFHSSNLHGLLRTNEPIEEQCGRLYTLTLFQIFQNELLQSDNYIGMKTYEEGDLCRFSVRTCGHENEKHAVTVSPSNLNVSCTCRMFEFEGVLCRHILRVFNMLDVKEIPSRFILHRWTRYAELGIVHNFDSGISSEELKNMMVWSLKEAASKYIEFGTSSLEHYKLAYEMMREGARKLCWRK
ncbi:protein FAR1-RELATED SEQUENCE 7-like [Rutidosis leptorrhynchoides]|uniref:protein FAR1-RELATED SEQUENCE 7-like n=1 Tax=Rutidosis leptorrhynchoides TaxID=125765 RepID=UPI003A997F45